MKLQRLPPASEPRPLNIVGTSAHGDTTLQTSLRPCLKGWLFTVISLADRVTICFQTGGRR